MNKTEAIKLAGFDLELRNPMRGRKYFLQLLKEWSLLNLELRNPMRGRKPLQHLHHKCLRMHLKLGNPKRGRKLMHLCKTIELSNYRN